MSGGRKAPVGGQPGPGAPAARPRAAAGKRAGAEPARAKAGEPAGRSVKPGAGLTGSADAKRRASLVLEVLSGLRTPLDASAVLGVSLQRYYLLEARAVQGLVTALEPKGRGGGRRPSLEVELRRVAAERDRLGRELLRAQALVRVAQRTVGLSQPEAARKEAGLGGKRRKRKATVRARRAASRLREQADAEVAGERTEAADAGPPAEGAPAPGGPA